MEDNYQTLLLNKHIKALKYKGVIKNNSDIARDLGYSRNTVSTYVTGAAIPSKDFISKFEKHYNVMIENDQEILDYKNSIVRELPEPYGNSNELKKTIRDLQIENHDLKNTVKDQLEIIKMLVEQSKALQSKAS
jgi:transcriptional regulator with XRE-family HTH domain